MGFTASDIADAYDARRLKRQRDLEEWVTDNPQWWAIGLATVGSTSMEFLGGYVDVLRLGEGAVEGGWGYGKDALRLVSILGPLGRIGKGGGMLARNVLPRALLKVAVKPVGITGPCTFQAVNNIAMLAKGKNLFLTIAEMAKAKGVKVGDLSKVGSRLELAAWIDELLPALRSLGIKSSHILAVNTIQGIAQLAKSGRRVIVFAIKCVVKTPNGKDKTIVHTVLAMEDAFGQVRYADYGGKLFGSLEDLVSRWGSLKGPIELYTNEGMAAAQAFDPTFLRELSRALIYGGALVLEGVQLIEIENVVEVAVPVTPVATPAPSQDDKADGKVALDSLDNFMKRKDGAALQTTTRPMDAPPLTVSKEPVRREPLRLDPINTYGAGGAPRADWLTGVQFRLNHLGFCAGRVDGVMGPKTLKAVRAFQKHYPPLVIDGIPGTRTQTELVRVCGY